MSAHEPSTLHSPAAMPSRLAAQRLIAVPWRHAGLIAACAVAGGAASAMLWLQQPAARVAEVKPRFQAIQDAPGMALRLDLEPGVAGTTMLADASPAVSSVSSFDDEIDAALRQAPPAAGIAVHATPDGAHPDATLPGLVAGLLLGLLLASVRELGGQRMRSVREAEWALGAPVLGAFPTLSTRARGALLEPRDAG